MGRIGDLGVVGPGGMGRLLGEVYAPATVAQFPPDDVRDPMHVLVVKARPTRRERLLTDSSASTMPAACGDLRPGPGSCWDLVLIHVRMRQAGLTAGGPDSRGACCFNEHHVGGPGTVTAASWRY